VTYPQDFVVQALLQNAVPVQIDNTDKARFVQLHRLHHIWTPDCRVLSHGGDELYRWEGFLPPAEFAPRMLCGFAAAHLREKRFDAAEALYEDVLRRFPTSYAAPEAQYYLGVTRYRRDPESDELLTQWAQLRSRYPNSEQRVKQSFKEMPDAPDAPH
jgi:tetratricopeptide (TPR) repeat protein